MTNMRAICINFKKVMLEDYAAHHDIIRCFMGYIGFLRNFAYTTPKDDTYGKFTDWQIADMCMSLHNKKIDTRIQRQA